MNSNRINALELIVETECNQIGVNIHTLYCQYCFGSGSVSLTGRKIIGDKHQPGKHIAEVLALYTTEVGRDFNIFTKTLPCRACEGSGKAITTLARLVRKPGCPLQFDVDNITIVCDQLLEKGDPRGESLFSILKEIQIEKDLQTAINQFGEVRITTIDNEKIQTRPIKLIKGYPGMLFLEGNELFLSNISEVEIIPTRKS